MQTVLIVIHLMVVLALVGVVLLQKSEGGGLGMGGGGGFMSSRGTANVLTRTTAILAAIFFGTSLALSMLAGYSREPKSILDKAAPAGQQAPAAPAEGQGVLDQIKPPVQPGPPQPPQSR
jgi:preprotein translocase subunit SecG